MYYEVKAKCGHVGVGNYVIKTFAVNAPSGKEAAEKCRWFPRVKHHWKDAILSVKKIDKEEFNYLLSENEKDDFFKCTCKQEQNIKCDLSGLILRNEDKEFKKKEKTQRKSKLETLLIKESFQMMRNYEYSL